jgi:hypothetical protein
LLVYVVGRKSDCPFGPHKIPAVVPVADDAPAFEFPKLFTGVNVEAQ